MKLTYERLESGYHHVKNRDAVHVFAQWRIGYPLTISDISHNGLSVTEQIAFIQRALDLVETERLKNIG